MLHKMRSVLAVPQFRLIRPARDLRVAMPERRNCGFHTKAYFKNRCYSSEQGSTFRSFMIRLDTRTGRVGEFAVAQKMAS